MRRIALALVAVLFSCLMVALPSPANAVDGCPSAVVPQHVSPWGRDTSVQQFPLSPSTSQVFFRLGTQSRYWYCPNGSNPAKIKVTHFTFCATKQDNRDPNSLQGFKFNPRYFTLSDANDTVVDPPQSMLHWSGTGSAGDSRCDGITIPLADQRWMPMPASPAWTLTGFVAYNNFPDDGFAFKAGADNKREFSPADDPIFNPFGRSIRSCSTVGLVPQPC